MIRELTLNDMDSVCYFADSIYLPDLYESDAKFRQLVDIFPKGQLGFFYNGILAGYIFSHPWLLEEIVPLDSLITLPDNPTCYYIHDMAIHSAFRGKGFASMLFSRVLELAEGMPIKLISIKDEHLNIDAHGFWMNLGFEEQYKIHYGCDNVDAKVMIKKCREDEGFDHK
jgi:GNAT superfamily N-acetyltransferase